MSGSMDVEVLRIAEEKLYLMAAAFEDALVNALIDGKGLTYGDVELSREERILKYIDDDGRGINAAMEQLDPKEALSRRNRFLRDVREAGLST